MSDRPNVLFVFADQMRGMAMGCAGNRQVRTDVLDRLAREGTRFTHAYANCPVCTPSRGTILTGRYPLGHGAVANDMPLRTDVETIAHVLGRAGWRCGYVGKWHLDGVPRDRFTPPGPRRAGFDDFWAAWNCSHDYFHAKVFRDGPEPVALDGYEPVAHTRLAEEFLRAGDGRPFCLFVSWGTPHAPYRHVPPEYLRLYDPAALTLRPNVRAEPPAPFRRLGAGPSREDIAGYYAHITALDEQLGRLLGVLEEIGAAEDTLVVFTSDHGDMLWSQGMVKKEQPWEESVNIPLLVRHPGCVPAGRVCDALVSTADLAPTIISLCGLNVPESMEGADLAGVFRGEPGAAGPESVFLLEPIIVDQGAAQGLTQWRGLRTRRWTYARWYHGGGWVLYDNQADPYQQRNLIDSPDHAAVRTEMEAMLRRWLDRTGDACVSWDETIRRLGLVEQWHERERYMHPDSPRRIAPGDGEKGSQS